MKAAWNNALIAESDATIVVEGNHYFPPDAIDRQFFEPNTKNSICPWKGTAHYYDVVVNGERNAAAAWYYREAKEAASNIQNYVAFGQGVDVAD